MTSCAKATFCATVLFGSSRKSWNTVPSWRRMWGTFQFDSRARSLPRTCTVPVLARSSRRSRRRKVDFPEPEDPTRKTNSPFSISRDTSLSAGWLCFG